MVGEIPYLKEWRKCDPPVEVSPDHAGGPPPGGGGLLSRCRLKKKST